MDQLTKDDGKNLFFCTNCGSPINSLYKKYSPTVLKLTQCENCKEVTDKYVEYDIVIIIIDLILLNPKAYRHILLNTEFKNFWKLLVIIILTESYCTWALSGQNIEPTCCRENKTEPSLQEFDMNLEDLKFYALCCRTAFSYLCFISFIHLLTKGYRQYRHPNNQEETAFPLIVKTITLSSAGIFLQLPSIIWDISLYSYHLHFITLYTCLSQLLAYRAIFNSPPKIWCLLVMFSSHSVKFFVSEHISELMEYIFIK